MTLVSQVQGILRVYDDKRADLNRDSLAFDSKCQRITVYVISTLLVIGGLFWLLLSSNVFSYQITWITPLGGKILSSTILAGGFSLLLTAIIATITNPEYKKTFGEKLETAHKIFNKKAEPFVQKLSPQDLTQTIQFLSITSEQMMSDFNLQHSQSLHPKTPSSQENFETRTRIQNCIYMAYLCITELQKRHETYDNATSAAMRKVDNLWKSLDRQLPI